MSLSSKKASKKETLIESYINIDYFFLNKAKKSAHVFFLITNQTRANPPIPTTTAEPITIPTTAPAGNLPLLFDGVTEGSTDVSESYFSIELLKTLHIILRLLVKHNYLHQLDKWYVLYKQSHF